MSDVLIRLQKNDALNSVNVSFGQESKSSHSNESFLLLKKMLRKNDEKNNCQKTYLVYVLPETEDHIN